MTVPTVHAPSPAVLAGLAPDVPVLDAAAALASTAGTAVVLLEVWTLGLAEELSRHALSHPVVHVPVRSDGALTIVGPVLRPGAAACLSCTEYQRLATAGGRVPWRRPTLALAGLPSPALAEAIGALAMELLAEEPSAAEPEPDLGSTVWIVHNGRATWSGHRVRPVGGCVVCHPLPPDTEQSTAIPAVPRPLPDPTVLRGPTLARTERTCEPSCMTSVSVRFTGWAGPSTRSSASAALTSPTAEWCGTAATAGPPTSTAANGWPCSRASNGLPG